MQPWLSFSGRNFLPVIHQTTATECGLACVAMLAEHSGVPTDLVTLRRKYPVSAKGATLATISACCTELGFSTRALRCSFRELDSLRTPCILHWRFNHFVVLKSVTARHLVIHDPARGLVKEPNGTARTAFTGIALEATAAPGLRRSRAPLGLRLSQLATVDADLLSKFSAGMLLALVSEALLLLSPFYLQVTIDQVLGKSDGDLLNVIALAFGLLLLLQLFASLLRQLTFQYLSNVLVFDLTTRVVRRLLTLSLRYFQNRELGDVQHRIQSLERIQKFMVQALPMLVLDALFLLLITALMALYHPGLTAVMLFTLGIWSAWRALIFPRNLQLLDAIAHAESSVQTHTLETLRAVQTIKLSNGEQQRASEWSKLFAAATNSRIRLGNLAITDGAVRQFLFQGTRIAAIYWLAKDGLGGKMSIGMISAYVAYLGMFATRACGVVDRILEYKLLRVPLNRLADIVFGEEEAPDVAATPGSVTAVEFRNLAFSYSRDESPVLRNCSARIADGEFIAIAGPSGSGKSTLLQLISGNVRATAGQVIIGDRPLSRWSLSDLRSQTATVFQGDRLVKGSVTENIALFTDDIDARRVRHAAVAACIAEEIESMPMAYETRIGDLGAALSRGQVQRILIARALYREPRLLLLDEATSGLSGDIERYVIDSIAALKATRIVVTHSDRMLQAADRVMWLHAGRLLLSRPELNVWGP